MWTSKNYLTARSHVMEFYTAHKSDVCEECATI